MSSQQTLYQCIISRETLTQLVAAGARAVPAKPIVHLLDNLKFDFGMNQIRVTGYDLQFGVVASTAEAPADASGDCSVLVKKDRIEGLVSLLPFEKIKLSVTSDYTLEIADADRPAKVYLRLQGQSASEYPEVQAYREIVTPEIIINGALLRRLIDYTRFATSYNDVRLYFNGIFFHAEGKKLVLVGTDGYRMAVVERELDGLPGMPIRGILPSRSIQEVAKLLPDDEVSLVFGRRDEDGGEGGHMQTLNVKWPGFDITMRLLDSTYPDYRRVIPTDNPGKAEFQRGELQPVVKTLLALGKRGQEIEKAGLLEVSVEKGLMRCASKSQEAEGAFEFAVDQEGPDIKIVFDGRYLQDMFSNVGSEAGDAITFAYSEPLKQALFSFSADDSFRYVMMPIREQ